MIGTAGGDSLKIKGDFLRAMHRCRSLPCPTGKARVRKSLLRHGSGAIKVEAGPVERVHPEWKSRVLTTTQLFVFYSCLSNYEIHLYV